MIHLYGLNFGHRPDLSYYREIVNVFMIHGHFPIYFSLALAPKQKRQCVLDKKVSLVTIRSLLPARVHHVPRSTQL